MWTPHDQVMQNPQGPEKSETMRQSEVLAELQVSRTTLLDMEKRGTITPFKLPSGHRRYRRAEVDALTERAS